MWMTGGLWGAYEQWEMGAAGSSVEERVPWTPHKTDIDELTEDTYVLLNRWDRVQYLVNSKVIEGFNIDCSWEGVVCEDGEPTGVLNPEAASIIQREIPEKSLDQRIAEAHLALERLASHG